MEEILESEQIFSSKWCVSSEMKIFESCVMPVMYYGADTWAVTKSQVNNLQKTLRAMERAIIGAE